MAATMTKAQKRDQKARQLQGALLNLSKYAHKEVRVKCIGGEEIFGILKCVDASFNLILYDKDPEEPEKKTEEPIESGIIILEGTSVACICSPDGTETIPNPFIQ